MEKVGQITAVTGDLLEVTFCRAEDCGHCHACDGGAQPTVVSVQGKGNVGDYAQVRLPASTVVKASLLAYAVPITGLMGGMLLGNALSGDSPAGGAVGGMIGLGVCLAVVWLTERIRRRSSKWQPVLTRVFPREWYENSRKEKV